MLKRDETAARGAGGSTTGAGAPAPSDRNSLTIGADGPVLLHDVHFLEQMAHFNREKVIERLATNGSDAPPAIGAVIETNQPHGYRLNPDMVRVVALSELTAHG